MNGAPTPADETAPPPAPELLVTRSHEDAVVEVTFNRPHRHNAFTVGMYAAMEELCATLRDDPVARVVVFRGAGEKAFAAGNEIADFLAMPGASAIASHEERVRDLMASLAALPQVTVAAVDGLAVGGGLALATFCDLRVATARSRFGYPIARTLGNALSGPLLHRCTVVFGESVTRQMLLTSRLVDASRADALGALTALCSDRAALEREVDELVAGLLAAAQITLVTTKRQLAGATAYGEDRAQEEALLREVYGGPAFAEGVAAFLEKRTPDFPSYR